MSKKEEEVKSRLTKAVVEGDEDLAERAAREAIDLGMDPYDTITKGLVPGMDTVGKLYEEKKYYLPDVLLSADAFYAALNLLLPLIPKKALEKRAKVVIGVVEGDIHDIGKNIVKTMLTAAGYEVIDLGRDVPIEEFTKAIKEHGADIVAMSTLMAPTLLSMKGVEDVLRKEGLKGQKGKKGSEGVKTIVGGAAVTPEWADEIGSDAYGKDAMQAVDKVKMLIEEIKAAAKKLEERKAKEESK